MRIQRKRRQSINLSMDAIETISPAEAVAHFTENDDELDYSVGKTHRIRADLKPRGIKLDEYSAKKGNSKKPFFCLKEGHTWWARLDDYFGTKRRCPKCFPQDSKGVNFWGQKLKIGYKEADRRARIRGATIIKSSYTMGINPAELKCLHCGHHWRVRTQVATIWLVSASKIACLKCRHKSKPDKNLKDFVPKRRKADLEGDVRRKLGKHGVELVNYDGSRHAESVLMCKKCKCKWTRKRVYEYSFHVDAGRFKSSLCPLCRKDGREHLFKIIDRGKNK